MENKNESKEYIEARNKPKDYSLSEELEKFATEDELIDEVKYFKGWIRENVDAKINPKCHYLSNELEQLAKEDAQKPLKIRGLEIEFIRVSDSIIQETNKFRNGILKNKSYNELKEMLDSLESVNYKLQNNIIKYSELIGDETASHPNCEKCYEGLDGLFNAINSEIRERMEK